MNARIILRHGSGSTLRGRESVFDGSRIRIGRAADNDLAFDPVADSLVSAHHAELRRRGESLWISDLGSRNGTFVNGARIAEPRLLDSADRVTLGANGPAFEACVEIVTSRVPSAIGGGPESAENSILEFDPRANTDGRREPRKRRILDPSRSFAGGIGMDTLLRVVRHHGARDRRRWVVGAAALVGILTMVLVVVLVRPDSGGVARSSEGPSRAPAFADVLGPRESSVYLVIERRRGTDGRIVESGHGTAWSVRPGWLATNAHVAALLERAETASGVVEIVARNSANPPHTLRIRSAKIHPGYPSFEELSERYRPFAPGDQAFLDVPTACDVAILEIEPADIIHQAPALTLASEEALRRLRGASPLATIGFPLEGIAGGGTDLTRPNATTLAGSLAKSSDVFFGKCDRFDDAIVLAYQLDAVGGSSGSPVFSETGDVLGLVAAGNVAGVAQNGIRTARITIGGTCYGPRVDLLRELLDGYAVERHRVREPVWRDAFLKAFRAGVADAQPLARLLAAIEIASLTKGTGRSLENVELVARRDLDLRAAGSGSESVIPMGTIDSGYYALVAIAKSHPIRIGLRAIGAEGAHAAPTQYFASMGLDCRDPAEVRIAIHGESDPRHTETSVECFVFALR